MVFFIKQTEECILQTEQKLKGRVRNLRDTNTLWTLSPKKINSIQYQNNIPLGTEYAGEILSEYKMPNTVTTVHNGLP